MYVPLEYLMTVKSERAIYKSDISQSVIYTRSLTAMDSHAIYGYENWKHANLVSFHNWKLGVSLKNDLLYHEFSTIYFTTWPD